MRKTSKYVVVAGALAALAAPSAALTVPSAAMADGPTQPCQTTLPDGTPLPKGLSAEVIGNHFKDGSTIVSDVNATGCDIGVYDPITTLKDVTIHGATQYGVYVDKTGVSVKGATVDNIGDQPMDGMQYGYGIYYTDGATGTISGNTVTHYQKNGIVANGADTTVSVTNNVVTGLGTVNFIAQNGIVVENGATATVTGNTVSQNHYGGHGWTATGILFYQANNAPKVGTISSANHVSQNQANVTVVS
jgi:hypothetical protein